MKKHMKKIIILCGICLIILIGGLILDHYLGKNYFTEIEFDNVVEKIENEESFVLLISQTTCTHCVSYKPKLEKVANKYKLDVYYIDVDLLNDEDQTAFASYISYSSTPTTVFIKNGKESTAANRINGDASQEKIENKLKSNGFID